MSVPEPLRIEHTHLLPHLESLPQAALALEGGGDPRAALDAALDFLHSVLIPHAESEDAALYPVVERVMKAPGATATMSRDHRGVVQLARDLGQVRDSLDGPPDPDQRRELQRLLYGLHAIIQLHFAKEEELYLPLLDAGLTQAEADDMFRAMRSGRDE
jgi:iron-sulfur cluster repair protein YtfE (RIC family)